MPEKAPDSGVRWRPVLIFSALIGLVALAYFFADRQLAAALRPHFAGERLFVWLTYIVKPLAPLATFIAVAIVICTLRHGRLTATQSALLRLSCAILIAGVLTFELKQVFGRTWPETWINNNPSYFGNGTYGFFPFHGGQGYASFPSGHTTAISALAGAVWILWPKLRWLGVALVLAVAVGLLGANYHWLSDIMAGAIVGGATGVAAARVASHKEGV